MFETLKEELSQPEELKKETARVGAVALALLALGAIIFVFAILPYAKN